MNPLHTFTIHTSRSDNIQNFLLPPNTSFFGDGVFTVLYTVDLVGFSDIENLLQGYRVLHFW